MANVIQDLINKYDEYRAKWVEFYGTDKGFNDWFTAQVTGQ